MAVKHTPGPWRIEDSGTKRIDHLNIVHGAPDQLGGASLVVAKVTCRISWLTEQMANARLISAAPELLEALILLEREMVESGNAGSVDYGWKPAITKTRAAIAKATGEQP